MFSFLCYVYFFVCLILVCLLLLLYVYFCFIDDFGCVCGTFYGHFFEFEIMVGFVSVLYLVYVFGGRGHFNHSRFGCSPNHGKHTKHETQNKYRKINVGQYIHNSMFVYYIVVYDFYLRLLLSLIYISDLYLRFISLIFISDGT